MSEYSHIQNNLFKKNISLKNFTTFKIGGNAEYFIQPRTIQDLKEVINWNRFNKKPIIILGNGSNVVVSDDGLPGLVVCMKTFMNNYYIENQKMVVQAGAMLPVLAIKTAKKGLRGIDFGIGIPGTIGGAVCMNAGVPGKTISDHLESIKVINVKNGKFTKMLKKELNFADRTSIFNSENDLIIVEATFNLITDNSETILAEMKGNFKKRKIKQPYKHPNAGCIFKREKNILPGKLIDNAGCKGLRCGGASVSHKHANFIINTGNATADNIWQLTKKVQEKVFFEFGVKLNTEVQFIGDFN